MIDILKNNLSNFNINSDNTIICDASEVENSPILSSISSEEKKMMEAVLRKMECNVQEALK